MQIDPRTYPSRAFIRFTAQNQLTADLTGQPITACVQRLGGERYVQKITPNSQAETIPSNDSNLGLSLGMSLDVGNAEAPSSEKHQSLDAEPAIAESIPAPTSHGSQTGVLDEGLFEEVAKITFSPNRYPELYQSCGTRRAAAAIEAQVANEIVVAYKRILLKQECPIVQGLNALL